MGCTSPLWEVPGLSLQRTTVLHASSGQYSSSSTFPLGLQVLMPMDVVMPKHLPETLPTPVRCLRNFHAYVWGMSVTAGGREPRAER
jgi:hypothetical protein